MERNIKVANLIKELSATFLGKENNHTSLITVTSCKTSPDLKRATIFITVLPDKKEHNALDFAKRKRKELREFIKKNMNIKVIPFWKTKLKKEKNNDKKFTNCFETVRIKRILRTCSQGA